MFSIFTLDSLQMCDVMSSCADADFNSLPPDMDGLINNDDLTYSKFDNTSTGRCFKSPTYAILMKPGLEGSPFFGESTGLKLGGC
jgi:hypothetical protein